MEQRGERVAPIMTEWLGEWILVRYWGGPKINADDAESNAPDYVASGPAEARQTMTLLEEVGNWGITVRHADDPPDVTSFLPWSAVMMMRGPSREAMEREQAEQTEEADPARRQELMDLLASAGTPTEVEVARAAADTWLASNPSDGDVRVARDHLPNPSGD